MRNMEIKRCIGHSWDSNISSTTATRAGAWMGSYFRHENNSYMYSIAEIFTSL